MSRSPIRARSGRGVLWASVLALTFPLGAGCGGAPASRPADKEAARKALRDALDAWKGGEAHDALAKRPSPIRVADEDWLAGSRLLAYQVEPGDREVGTNLACNVVLTLKGAKGREVKKRVLYNVGTDPVPSIVRQD